jgi:hypothetical protein
MRRDANCRAAEPLPILPAKLFPQKPISWSDIEALVIFSGTLILITAIASGRLSLAAIGVVVAVSVNALVLGRAALSILPSAPPGFRPPAEIAIGMAAVGIIIWFGNAFLGMTAGTAFLVSGALGLAALAYIALARRRWGRWDSIDLAVLSGICLVSVVWSWEAIEAMPNMRADGRFPVWADYINHAIPIALFAQAGAPLDSFFHLVGYMVPASINGLAEVPALVCATALYTTLGYILMGMGAYALGTVLGDRPGGIAAVAALFLIPNAAHYGFHNPFFDFHWLEQISTGGSQATGLAFVAIALAVLARRRGSAPAFWLSVATSLGVLAFRSHIFLSLAVAEILLLAFLWKPPRIWLRLSALAAVALIAAMGVLIAERNPRTPHLLSDWPPHPIQFVTSMLRHGSPIYSNLFATIDRSFPAPMPLLIGIVYLLLAVGGGMLIAYVLGPLCLDRRLPAAERAVPLSFIAAFLIVALAIPPTHGADPFDVQHRQFVLLYGVLAVWSGSYVGSLAVRRLGQRATRVVLAVAFLLLPVPFLLSGTVQSSMLSWAPPFVGLVLPPGMLDAANFIRAHSAPRDVVMASSTYYCGPLAALLERYARFPAECDYRTLTPATTTPPQGAPSGSVQEQMLNAASYEQFLALARQQRIAWFIAYSANPPASWLSDKSAWRGHGFFVIRVDAVH